MKIITEYLDVLRRNKINLPQEIIIQWSCLFDEQINLVIPERRVDFPRDRKDAKFLECALACDADVFVTEDKDSSEAQALVSTLIMTITQFKFVFMDV